MLPGQGRESGFVALRGRFDLVRLEALAREHHAVVEDYKGVKFVRTAERTALDQDQEQAAEPRRPRRNPALAFVDSGLIIVGEAGGIRRAIDTHASGQNVTSNGEVMQLIKEMDSGANAWAVGRFDVLASQATLPEGMAAQIPSVKWFAAAGRINGGMSGVLRAEARDDQAAQNLRDVVNGFLALARMQAGSKPQFQELLKSVTLGGTGTSVELSFTVPAELIHAIEGMAGAKRREGEAH
jgi:hypothetical protein